jgi:hypothetical protein
VITIDQIRSTPLVSVATAAEWTGIPERSFRDALAGDLEHLAVRVGRRVYIRTSALLAWVGRNGGASDDG